MTGSRTLQDLIPRGDTFGEQDRTIGHRALGRLVLRPAAGRVYTDPETGQRYTVANATAAAAPDALGTARA